MTGGSIGIWAIAFSYPDRREHRGRPQEVPLWYLGNEFKNARLYPHLRSGTLRGGFPHRIAKHLRYSTIGAVYYSPQWQPARNCQPYRQSAIRAVYYLSSHISKFTLFHIFFAYATYRMWLKIRNEILKKHYNNKKFFRPPTSVAKCLLGFGE